MKKTFYVGLFLILSIMANAQVKKRDSLFKLLTVSQKDTGRVMLLLNIADTYETNNQDSARYYLEKSKQLSDILNFKKGIYKYYELSAIVSFTKGDYKRSLQESEKALELARKLKDSSLILNMLNNTGIVYQYLGEFDKQLDYTLQAMALIERLNKKEKLTGIYHNVANAYFSLKQYRKSIDYCLLALKLHQKTGSNAYVNRLHATLGQSYALSKFTDSALYYYKIAAVESVKSNDKYAEAAIYGYMSSAYADKNDFKEMLKVSQTSLKLSRELQSNQILASSLYNIAYANYFNGNNAEAKKNIEEALQIAEKDFLKDELKNIYTVLSYIASRDGDFKTSLWAKQKNDSIQESLWNDQVLKTTQELEKKYESEKKDNQIKLQKAKLQKRTFLNYILIGSAATLLIISLLSYRNYRHKRKLQELRIGELETDKLLTATEAVLKGEEQERSRLAKDLHDGLGGMLAGIKYSFQTMKGNLIMTPQNQQSFERSMDMLDSSIKEMRRVAQNMMPESLVKFGLDTALKDYCKDINLSGALQITYQSIGMAGYQFEQTTAITIYRIIQELINNTLKHASAKTAIVQITKSDSLLTITAEDDGKGFDPKILDVSKGVGWVSIKHRVDFLKGRLDINSQPGNGTSVHIEVDI